MVESKEWTKIYPKDAKALDMTKHQYKLDKFEPLCRKKLER